MSWDSVGNKVERGPWSAILIVASVVLFGGFVVLGLSCVLTTFGKVAKVAQEELGPSALLKKYSDFKDMAAVLEAKKASIEVNENLAANMEKDKASWQRQDKEAYYLLQAEIAGMKSSFNQLASEYNSNMSKIHYRFCNTGELPQGAKDPLRREFKAYLVK